jgi:hypothetical protein
MLKRWVRSYGGYEEVEELGNDTSLLKVTNHGAQADNALPTGDTREMWQQPSSTQKIADDMKHWINALKTSTTLHH